MFQGIRRWFDSLKNRAVGLVVLLVVLVTCVATLIALTVGQSELEGQARNQLSTYADLIAGDIDAKLAERFDAITRVSRSLSMSEESLRGRAQLILNRQEALSSLFHRLYLVGHEGGIIASLPDIEGISGINVSDREYFKLTSQQLTTLISEPFVSRDERLPIVVITSPIFDHDQHLIGILIGSINLDERSFLGDLQNTRIGDTGFIGIGTRSGLILVHPTRSSELTSLNHSNPLHRSAQEGDEGVTLASLPDGGERLVAYRQLNEAPWFVTVSLPVKEAFKPIRTLSKVMLGAAVAMLALFIPLSLRLFSRLLSPIQRLAEQVKARHLGLQHGPLDVGGGAEIRQLVETFSDVRDQREAARQELEQQEAYFRSLSERSPIGIIQTDVLGRIEFVNPAFEAIIGSPLERLRNQYFLMGVYRDDQQQLLADWKQVLRKGDVYRGEYRLYDRQADRIIWVSVMTSPIQTRDRSLGTISVIRDITQELEVEAELKSARSRAEHILGVLDEGVIMTDSHGFISFANPPSLAFIGNPTSIVGYNLFDLITVEIDGRLWSFADLRHHPQATALDAVMTNASREIHEVELTMLRLGGEQSADQFVFVLRDDSERRRHEERLSWEASHDSLTRLSNRRAFNASLSALLQQDNGQGNASVVMLIDLDHFKPVNDIGGHLLGDELLRHISDVLRSRVRQSDIVARLGGDEFGVILPACGMERAQMIAEALRAGIEGLVLEQNGRQFGVTASIGLTNIVASDSAVKDVVIRADEGAYMAKAQGRNRVIVRPAGRVQDEWARDVAPK